MTGVGSALVFEPLEGVDELDQLLFQTDALFYRSAEWAAERQQRHIQGAFRHHFDSNPAYRAYCVGRGVTPDDLEPAGDLWRIPLLPSSLFKVGDVLSGPLESIVKTCTSSGTQGSISRVYRDEQTLCRFLGSMQSVIDDVLKVRDLYGLHLGPSRDEAGDLWISYVLGIADLLCPTDHFVRDGVFRPAALMEQLITAKSVHKTVALIGPPILFLELLEFLDREDLNIPSCENVMVMTAGGWKRFSGQAISREALEEALCRRFTNLKRSQVRDSFNMVEMNTAVAECEDHVKHVPPWLLMTALDPETLTPLPPDTVGLLAFLDPTPTSYPGFVLTDDLAAVSAHETCACGRATQKLSIVRRVRSIEARGCALKIDRQYVAPGQART